MVNLNFQITDEAFELLKIITTLEYNAPRDIPSDIFSLIDELFEYDLIEHFEHSMKCQYVPTTKGHKVISENK